MYALTKGGKSTKNNQYFCTLKKSNTMAYALVTGGSSGIGYAYAEELAQKGYDILVVSNREDLNQSAQASLQQNFPNIKITTLYADLTDADAPQRLLDYCHENGMEVEVLVNNAGMFYFGAVVDHPAKLTEKMVMLHNYAPASLCALFGAEMKARHKGYILNASSITAYMTFPTIAAYEASKAFLLKFSKGLAFELSHHGVKVCAVCPGAVDTDLYNLSPNLRKWLCRFGIMLKPRQVAHRGVRALFNGRKRKVPGLINHFFIFCCLLLPGFLVDLVKKKFV